MTWFGTSNVTSFACVTARCCPTPGSCQTASRAPLAKKKLNVDANALSPRTCARDGLVFCHEGGILLGSFGRRPFLLSHMLYHHDCTLSACCLRPILPCVVCSWIIISRLTNFVTWGCYKIIRGFPVAVGTKTGGAIGFRQSVVLRRSRQRPFFPIHPTVGQEVRKTGTHIGISSRFFFSFTQSRYLARPLLTPCSNK